MKKYLTIIKTELQKQFAYRYEIASFVPGNFFELFFAYLLWTIIYQTADVVKGYTYHEMVTYIIVGWVFSFITSTYNFESNISRDIRLGSLTNYLLKPVSYLKFTSVTAVGRVGIAFWFILLQSVVYVSLFGDKMIFNITTSKVLILLLMMIFAFVIKLFISILIGLMSFWFTEISGLHAFTDVLVRFFSGAFFPLILLPVALLRVSYFLPFMYTFFIPVQFFLDRISRDEALLGIGVQFIWCVLLYLLIKIVWKFGLKKYEAFGG